MVVNQACVDENAGKLSEAPWKNALRSNINEFIKDGAEYLAREGGDECQMKLPFPSFVFDASPVRAG